MLICFSSAAIMNISMKLGITCVSHGVLQTPNILSAPNISSIANKINAIIRNFHAPSIFLCVVFSSMLTAMLPAIMLRNTFVSSAIPYTQSYGVNIKSTSLLFLSYPQDI